jgi:hypothetical protein
VDSGRELMVPGRVAQGERLYRDVAFHHGPLGPYLGAGAEGLFGRSLPVRTGLAAAIALLHLAALVRLARRLMPAGRAALAAAVAVACAVFLRPGGWMFPFSFDAAIAVAALTWALELAARDTRRWDALAGAALAAALLARVELGLAGVAVIAVAALGQPRRLVRLGAWPLVAAAAGYAAVSLGIPRSTLENDGWLRLLDPPEAVRHVYHVYAGLDRPGLRLTELLLCAAILIVAAAILASASLVASRLRSRGGRRAVEAAAILVLAFAAAAILFPSARLAPAASLVPPLVRIVPAAVIGGVLWTLGRRLTPRGRKPAPLAVVPDGATWLAALFAARILLAAGYVGTYDSLFLPLPVVVAAAGLFRIADRAAGVLGAPLPRLTAMALGVFLAGRVATTARFFRGPGWTRVETPKGAIVLPEPVAGTTRLALADLARRLEGGATFAGFPEGGFFTYVLGARSSLAHEQFFPGRLDAAAEQEYAAALARRPPDVVLLANVLAVGEGARIFGVDYLRDLHTVLQSRTRTAAIYGPGARAGARIGDPDFFVEIRTPDP